LVVPHLVALVRAGARFDKGVLVERPDEVREVAAGSSRIGHPQLLTISLSGRGIDLGQ
jgi:hypothetical protein